MSPCKHPVTHADPDGKVECLVCGETWTVAGPTYSWGYGLVVSSLPALHVVFMGSKLREVLNG